MTMTLLFQLLWFPRHACRGLIEAMVRRMILYPMGWRFPRHACRGLIEAQHCAVQDGTVMQAFPRHACRGLIEARQVCGTALRSQRFRGMRAAASLKRI